ncbi:MAG: hypothetical protein AB7K52_14555 [Phycisphaerales bacterium]
MASAKDLFNKLGNSSGGFPKPAPKAVIPPVDPDADGGDKAGKSGGKHFDPSQKGHNLRKGAGGPGGSVPTSVRPKV